MTIANFIYIFGAVGIFIYGMMLLSDSLEKAAGDKLKNILSSMTNNRFLGLFTGLLVTSVIQSSSATTVMVVSFVNAGLLSLGQAIGVIMGANIGTTVTAWIINLTNMKFDITLVAYSAIISGIVLLFLKKKKFTTLGYCFIGFGFLFVGLELLEIAVPKPTELEKGNWLYNFFQWLPKENYASLFVFLFIGTIFTTVVQSSSVMMAFTITLATQGYIDFPHAAAMVLGENIGTTITAIAASLAGNKMAKKAAAAHCMFNVIGVCWVLLPFFFHLFTRVCQKLGGGIIGVELALFHTFFNLANAGILVWFVPQFEWLLTRSRKKENIRYSLLSFDKGIITSPDIALLEVTKEIEKQTAATEKIFAQIDKLLSGDKEKEKRVQKITEEKEEINQKNNEITLFLNRMLNSDISATTASNINKMLFQISVTSNIIRSCGIISGLIDKEENFNIQLFTKSEEELNKILYKINLMFKFAMEKSVKDKGKDIYTLGVMAEEDIDKLYWKMKRHTVALMKKKSNKTSITNGLVFLDIIKELEHIGDDLQKILSINNEEEPLSL